MHIAQFTLLNCYGTNNNNIKVKFTHFSLISFRIVGTNENTKHDYVGHCDLIFLLFIKVMTFCVKNEIFVDFLHFAAVLSRRHIWPFLATFGRYFYTTSGKNKRVSIPFRTSHYLCSCDKKYAQNSSIYVHFS